MNGLHHAAVDVNVLAGEIARLVRGRERNMLAKDLIWVDKAFERDAGVALLAFRQAVNEAGRYVVLARVVFQITINDQPTRDRMSTA